VARARLIANLAAVVAVAPTALALAVGSARAAERCCFLVHAAASGHAFATNGPDLEHPGAYAYRARWRWSVRHVARYVEHGRIFNALTAPRWGRPRSMISFRVSETLASMRGQTCRQELHRRVVARGDRAYVSLEDGLDGRLAVVLRARLPALRPRCNDALAFPLAHETRAPAGAILRDAPLISLRWRGQVADAGAIPVTVTIRVRLRFAPEYVARRLARDRQGWSNGSASRSVTRATKSSSAAGS
jgi:hypothetical protein